MNFNKIANFKNDCDLFGSWECGAINEKLIKKKELGSAELLKRDLGLRRIDEYFFFLNHHLTLISR